MKCYSNNPLFNFNKPSYKKSTSFIYLSLGFHVLTDLYLYVCEISPNYSFDFTEIDRWCHHYYQFEKV